MHSYEEIRGMGRTKPEGISDQIWRRMRRVARDPKLLTVNPSDLPTSLDALLELTRLSEGRFKLLRENGLVTPELTAKRVRQLAEGDAVVAYIEVRLYEDGRMEMGGVVPEPGGRGGVVARLPAAGPPDGVAVRAWVARRDRQVRKDLERGRWRGGVAPEVRGPQA
jgi:hypothetical protein